MADLLEKIDGEQQQYEDTTHNSYLSFDLDGEVYGIEIKYIKEVQKTDMVKITSIPQTLDYIRGVINLRGDIVPVIDVRMRFLKAIKEYDDQSCIIVTDMLENEIGLVVDSVRETITLDAANIVSPPSVKMKYHNQFIKNIGKTKKDVLLLLDLEKLLVADEGESA
jgi:purine-binding chemotaxis protein CheW